MAEALAAGLSALRPAVRVLSLDGIPSDSPWPHLLGSAWASTDAPSSTVLTHTEHVPLVQLGEDGFEEWLRERPASYRKQLRRAQRALQADGGSCGSAEQDDLPAAVADLVRLHEGRWRARGGSRVMSVGLYALLQELADRPETAPSFRVVVLQVSGRTVGAQALMSAGTRQYAWFHGFEAGAARFSPGHLLLKEVVRQAAQAKAKTIDLGHGSHEYKRTIANSGETVAWVSLIAPGAGRRYRRILLLPVQARPRLARALPDQAAVHVRRALNFAAAARREWRSRKRRGDGGSSRP